MGFGSFKSPLLFFDERQNIRGISFPDLQRLTGGNAVSNGWPSTFCGEGRPENKEESYWDYVQWNLRIYRESRFQMHKGALREMNRWVKRDIYTEIRGLLLFFPILGFSE